MTRHDDDTQPPVTPTPQPPQQPTSAGIEMMPVCYVCRHFHGLQPGTRTQTCDAFPAGIPAAIWANTRDHRQPVQGDHGIQFAEKPGSGGNGYADLTFRTGTLNAWSAAGNAAADVGSVPPSLPKQGRAAKIPSARLASESAFDLSNDWLYAWGDLPTTLAGLRDYLKEHGISVEGFKDSARYEANYDRFPWLKDL